LKGKLRFIILTGLFLLLAAGFMSESAQSANMTQVICEDGEIFPLKEWGSMEASNIPTVKGDLIVIDARKLRLTLYRNGKMLRTFPVAIGEPETPTPIGEWKIIHKGGNWGNGFGVRWIGLNVPWGIYGIHGTNKPWTIGSHASHGCIRMFNRNVLELYELVKLGTPVRIIGDLPKVAARKEIARNNTGRDVVAIQFALRRAGFNPGNADGRFGLIMEQAVYKLQRFYGLAVTGKIGLNEQYFLKIR
jgi:hypothetical protein